MELHWLARGVITYDGAVLTMRSTGGSHTFLPGGHVETDIAEDLSPRSCADYAKSLPSTFGCPITSVQCPGVGRGQKSPITRSIIYLR